MKHRKTALHFVAAFCAVIGLTAIAPQSARADDGYTSPFAQAVRAATGAYRLALWARTDHYVQTTGYVDGVGTMYTNHDRFNPADLAHPSMLVYDEGGRLVACGYQFTAGATYPKDFSPVPTGAWYDIPKHVHYNVMQGGTMHYAQAPWEGNDQATDAALRAHGLLPQDATLVAAFIHPATRAILVWAWLPNVDGLFADTNALMP